MITKLSHGIPQSDITVRTAFITAMDDMRNNPWLLDYCFAWLLHDSLTLKEYGQDQVNKAKEFFLKNDIPVVMSHQPDLHVPRLVIVPVSDDEAQGEQTHADMNADTTETVDAKDIVGIPAPVVGPLTPIAYDQTTGIVTLPPGISTDNVYPGMRIVDRQAQRPYLITDVGDSTVTIATGIAANFTDAIIAPLSNLYIARLASASYRETFRIEPHVAGTSPLYLYMHSIIKFILNRYRKDLFEARGFERTTVSSGQPGFYKGENDPEVVFVRPVTLTGYTRNYWPQEVSPLIQAIDVQADVLSNADDITDPEEVQGWGTVLDDE